MLFVSDGYDKSKNAGVAELLRIFLMKLELSRIEN